MLASCGIYITLICHKKLYFKNKIESIEEQLTNRAGDQGLKIKKTHFLITLKAIGKVMTNEHMLAHAFAWLKTIENT